MPHRELADGVLILVGGTLMLTPGFVSDIFGIAVHPADHPPDRPSRSWPGVISRRLVGRRTHDRRARGVRAAEVTPTQTPGTTTPRTR